MLAVLPVSFSLAITSSISPIIVFITRHYLTSSFIRPLYSSISYSFFLCPPLLPNSLLYSSSPVTHLSHCASFPIPSIFSLPFPYPFSLHHSTKPTHGTSLTAGHIQDLLLSLPHSSHPQFFLPLHLFQSCPTYFPQLLLPWSSRRLTHSPPILRLLSVSPLQQIHTYTFPASFTYNSSSELYNFRQLLYGHNALLPSWCFVCEGF